MLTPWPRLSRHAPSTLSQRRHITDFRPFAAGDLVLLREKLNRAAPPILTRPLKPGRQVESHKGIIKHDDLIGKRVRDVVTTALSKSRAKSGKEGTEYRLHDVKLEDYVRLSKRLVTPVYPADARLIVELLDLHPGVLNGNNDAGAPRLEILEAGTGHGALTLYLSRAIHGANAPVPRAEALETWQRGRRAVLHTLDVSEKYSLHARGVVQGFRHGLYQHNVDFHVSSVSDWLREQLALRSSRPFLSHAVLDLPGADRELARVADALRVDGTLVVFNPSITQITQCAAKVKNEGIPLELERVVELPTNGEAGGREWDVRAVKPRATMKSAREVTDEVRGVDVLDSEGDSEGSASVDSGVSDSPGSKEDWHMVCRPKVGGRVVGGGFVGVWKKQRAAAS